MTERVRWGIRERVEGCSSTSATCHWTLTHWRLKWERVETSHREWKYNDFVQTQLGSITVPILMRYIDCLNLKEENAFIQYISWQSWELVNKSNNYYWWFGFSEQEDTEVTQGRCWLNTPGRDTNSEPAEVRVGVVVCLVVCFHQSGDDLTLFISKPGPPGLPLCFTLSLLIFPPLNQVLLPLNFLICENNWRCTGRKR